MGKCLFMRKGETHTAPVNYKANFADNTWEQIIDACQKNAVPETWVVGDQKTMTINGTDYLIDIIGKNHDTYSDGSGTAPLTFQMHDLYSTEYAMNSSGSNDGGWYSCVMRNTYLPSILSLMPSEVQSSMKKVNKLTSAGSQSSTIKTSADKLFLLSEIEILGLSSNSASGEGTQYDYYKAGNSSIKKHVSGSSASWWYTRSPYYTDNVNFIIINTSGESYRSYATNKYSVSFAFCF